MDAQLHSPTQGLVCEALLHLPLSFLVEVGLFKKRVVSGTLAGGLLLRFVGRSRASQVLAELIIEAVASETNPRPFLATHSAFLTRVVGRVQDVWSR